MKKLIICIACCSFGLFSYSQDNMNKKMDNKSDKMNKKMDNKSDKMNKKIENVPDSIRGKSPGKQIDSSRKRIISTPPKKKSLV